MSAQQFAEFMKDPETQEKLLGLLRDSMEKYDNEAKEILKDEQLALDLILQQKKEKLEQIMENSPKTDDFKNNDMNEESKSDLSNSDQYTLDKFIDLKIEKDNEADETKIDLI